MKEEYKIPEAIKKFSEEISGGWFNFRVVKHVTTWKDKEGKKYEDITYQLHEVYYTAKGEILGWSEEVSLYFEDYADVKETIKHIKDACKKTVLLLIETEDGEELIDTHKYMKGMKRFGRRSK